MTLQHPDDDQRITYALDDLEPHERAAIRAHLESCEPCRTEVGQLSRALASERAPRRAGAPLHLLVGLLDSQATARRRDATRRVAARLAVAAALGGLLFSGGYWQGRQALERRPTDRFALEHRVPFPPLPPLPLATEARAATYADYLAYTPDSRRTTLGDTRNDSL